MVEGVGAKGGRMKRLTFDGNFCDIAMCQETPGSSFCEDGYCTQRKVWDRLKQYEDIGLEPEKIVFLKNVVDDAFSDKPEFTEHIRELLWAEKDGRLVVLPCKVGDTIYRCGDPIKKIYEWQIAYVEVYDDETVFVDDSDNTFVEADIGKTVFLTREEAEKALEGLQWLKSI